MGNRITRRDLEARVRLLNQTLDRPTETYTRTPDGQYRANLGNIYINGAYGGWQIVVIVNDGGAIRNLTYGFVPARQVYDMLTAMLNIVSEQERVYTQEGN